MVVRPGRGALRSQRRPSSQRRKGAGAVTNYLKRDKRCRRRYHTRAHGTWSARPASARLPTGAPGSVFRRWPGRASPRRCGGCAARSHTPPPCGARLGCRRPCPGRDTGGCSRVGCGRSMMTASRVAADQEGFARQSAILPLNPQLPQDDTIHPLSQAANGGLLADGGRRDWATGLRLPDDMAIASAERIEASVAHAEVDAPIRY